MKDKMSVIRTIILIVALINQILSSTGKSPLPISDETIESIISTGFTLAASLWAWWKNNYISRRGLRQKEVLKSYGLYRE